MNAKRAKKLRRAAQEASPPGMPYRRYVVDHNGSWKLGMCVRFFYHQMKKHAELLSA